MADSQDNDRTDDSEVRGATGGEGRTHTGAEGKYLYVYCLYICEVYEVMIY